LRNRELRIAEFGMRNPKRVSSTRNLHSAFRIPYSAIDGLHIEYEISVVDH